MRIVFLLLMLIPSIALGAVTVSVNGSNHTIPQTGEKGWGNSVTAWIQAISAYTLQPSGGSFTLTADANFGANYGLVSPYFKSRSSNLSSVGVLRLANTDKIGFRNNANSADLLLGVDSSDRLTFNGSVYIGSSEVQTLLDTKPNYLTLSDNRLVRGHGTTAIQASGVTVTDADEITGATIDADSNTISNLVDGNFKSSAGLSLSKLAAITTSRALVSNGSGVISASSVTSTTLGYLDATSSVQTQLNAKAPTASPTFTGTVNIGTTAGVLTSNASGVVSSSVGFGTTGQFLQSTGSTTPPTWGSVSAKVTGEVFMTAATSCPAGSTAANGTNALRTGGTECGGGSCANLYAAIGTTYGTADGTHFNFPDMRGVFPRGAGTQTISGTSYTGTQGTAQRDQFQGHRHNPLTGTSFVTVVSGSVPSGGGTVIGTTSTTTGDPTSDGTNGTTRAGAETRPANIVFMYCIVY